MADVGLKNETFYEVVATVIPLVAIVLLIQDRPWDRLSKSFGFDRKTWPRAEKTLALIAIVLLAALALAEAAALDVLYHAPAKSSLLNRVLIMVGLLAGALGAWVPLAVNALLRFDEALKKSPPQTEGSVPSTIKIMTRDWQRLSVFMGGALIVILVAAAMWFFPHFWPA